MITFEENVVNPPPLSTTPDPCPFCQHRAADEYSLLFHIESRHTNDSPFAPRNLNDETTDVEDMYVKCPEPGCEELLRLMELQNHMDFHSAEAVVDNGEAPRKKRSSHHKREGRDQQHGREHRERRHRDKERDGRDEGKQRHRERDRGRGDKRREVMFIAPPRRARSPVKSSLSWFERAALAIYPVHAPQEPPPRRRRSWSRGAERGRRRSHSRGVEERSSRVKQDVTVKRSKSASSHRHRHRSDRDREKSKLGSIKKLGVCPLA
jgi:hypothetical protein